MQLISKGSRYLFTQWKSFFYLLRVIKLKLLYAGITIDFKTKIEKNCDIMCVDGGKLIILNSHISFGTIIKADKGSSLSIYNSFIGRNCVITSKEKVIINKNCLIAEMVVIRDQDHDGYNDFNISPIVIKENVWIASKATVLKGVTIGEHAVLAASAVVTKNVLPYEVWAGVPAKFLKVKSPKAAKKVI